MQADELLEALPGAELRMTYLGQHVCGSWACFMTHAAHSGSHYTGDATTHAGAIIAALKDAGVNVDFE